MHRLHGATVQSKQDPKHSCYHSMARDHRVGFVLLGWVGFFNAMLATLLDGSTPDLKSR